MFWDGPADGSGVGDASIASYDAATEFAGVLRSISGSGARVNQGGVFFGELGNLAATSVGTSPVTIATGRAIAYGTWYENTAPVNVGIPTPVSSTRVDLIVLRKSWAAQTVRITRIAGTEGAGVPGMIQSVGTTWDVPLASASINTSGVVTVTDLRETGSILGVVVPTKTKFDTNGAPGVSAFGAHADHIHEIDDPAAPVLPVSVGVAASGVSLNPSRDDHVHGGMFCKYKTANQLKTAILGTDADLQCSVLGGKVYAFQAVLMFGASNQLTVSTSGGSAGQYSTLGKFSGAVVQQDAPIGALLVFDSGQTTVHIRGTFTTIGAGTFGIVWGDNVGGGVTLNRFSHLIVTEVA